MNSPKRVKLENKSEEKLAQILLKLLDGDDNEDRDLVKNLFLEIYNANQEDLSNVEEARISYSNLEKKAREDSTVTYCRKTEYWTLPLHSNQSLYPLLMNAAQKEYNGFKMYQLLPQVQSGDSNADKKFIEDSIKAVATSICEARFDLYKITWEANVIGEKYKIQFAVPKPLNISKLMELMCTEKGLVDYTYPCSEFDFF